MGLSALSRYTFNCVKNAGETVGQPSLLQIEAG
jgi:hypothetical protein